MKLIKLTKGYYTKTSWHANIRSDGVVRARGGPMNKEVYLSTVLLNVPKGKVVDHINRDTLLNKVYE